MVEAVRASYDHVQTAKDALAKAGGAVCRRKVGRLANISINDGGRSYSITEIFVAAAGELGRL